MKKQLLFGAFIFGAFVTANAQNSCAEAIPLVLGTNNVGTVDGEYLAQANGGCWATGATTPNAEWYTFTPDTDMMVRINTNLPANDPATVDTRVSVYTGECGTLECYNGSDDINPAATGGNYLTDFTFVGMAGVTYYIAFDDRWSDAAFVVEVSSQTPACDSTTPYLENWAIEANYYFCWDSFNIDDDALGWQFNNVNDWTGDNVDDAVLALPSVSTANGNAPKNDWAISGGLELTQGVEYSVVIKYAGLNNGADQVANEDLELFMLNEQDPEASGSISIGQINDITMPAGVTAAGQLEENATTEVFTFTPQATATHYLGLHATSEAASGWLVVFDIYVNETLGTSDVASTQFSVYPNPATNVINIANADNALVNGVEIVDINGRTVKTVNFNNVSEAQINISDLSAGMYLMNISSDKGTTTKKIVKN